MLWHFCKNTLAFSRKSMHLIFSHAYNFLKPEKLHLILIYVSTYFTLLRHSEYTLLENIQL